MPSGNDKQKYQVKMPGKIREYLVKMTDKNAR
jgi:hypothetical protein